MGADEQREVIGPLCERLRAEFPYWQLGRIETLLHERHELGCERYGQPLAAFNGRDALWDALEEAADLAMYIQQARMEERNVGRATMLDAALTRVFYTIDALMRMRDEGMARHG